MPISVAFLSTGIILSYKLVGSERRFIPFFLCALYVLSLTLVLMRFVRFDVLSGTDNLWEYKTALETLRTGHWTSDQRGNPFATSLTVSVFPVMYSEVSGINLIPIFQFILPAIGAFIPVLLFLVVKEVFKNVEVASITSILYAESIPFWHGHFELNRLIMALIFTLLFLLLVFRHRTDISKRRTRTHVALCSILLLSIIFSHYSLPYFLTLLFLVLIFCPYFIRISSKKLRKVLHISVTHSGPVDNYLPNIMVLFFVATSFAWFLYFGPSIFESQISDFYHRGILASFGIYPKRYSSMVGYVFESPMGPITTMWLDLTTVLLLTSLLYMWFRVYKDTKLTLWTMMGTTLMLLVSLWYVIPGLSTLAGLNRLYGLASLVSFSFLAYVLIKCNVKMKGLLLAIFLFVNLPMNMMLFSHNDDAVIASTLYHPYGSIAPKESVRQVYNTLPGFAMGVWVNDYAPQPFVISGDYRGRNELFYAIRYKGDFTTVPEPTFAYASNYLALHSFYLRHNLWTTWSAEGGRVSFFSNQSSLILLKGNAIYSNERYILLQRFGVKY
jgi:uncharacterized membrane protein